MPLQGWSVTRYHHVPLRPAGLAHRIEVVEAAHPVPDAAGLAAAQRMLALAQGLQPQDLVLCLVSGGASALLTLPVDLLTLPQKQALNQALLASGASISEMNCVRKHLSRIKGGRLAAAACAPARVVTLAISDVPGDDPATIGSGPTVPDATRLRGCTGGGAPLPHLRCRYRCSRRWRPARWRPPNPGTPHFRGMPCTWWRRPSRAWRPPPRLPGRPAWRSISWVTTWKASRARSARCMRPSRAPSARRSQPFARPCVILSGGETTDTLRAQGAGTPRGRGGRAGEFCLGLAQALQGQAGVYALAADTDGIDGVEDNAGAFVAPDTLARAQAKVWQSPTTWITTTPTPTSRGWETWSPRGPPTPMSTTSGRFWSCSNCVASV